jgi:acyltransferase
VVAIMIPYIASLVVTLLVHIPIHMHRGTLTSEAVILPLMGGSLNAGPFGAYWFMSALFISAFMFRALERVPLVLRVALIVGITVVIYLFG